MARRTYGNFRIKELDGGLNTENSPNEIDNKQCLLSENFNFSGNKLISGKTYGLVYDTVETIYAMNDIDGEFYYLSGSGLYKNETKINTSGKSAYLPGTLNVGTSYGVNINGTAYSKTVVRGDTIKSVLDNIVAQINNVSTLGAEVGFINIGSADYPSINLFGTITSLGGINLSLYTGETITGITDGQILKNGLDIIIIGNGKGYFLQKVVKNSDVNNIGYIIQPIPFKEKPIQGMAYGGKLFYITGSSNILYFSKTADALYNARVKDFGNEATGDLYDAGLQMVGGDGIITGLLAGENGIYVFKKNEVYYSNSTNDDGVGFAFVLNKIASSGAESYKAITSVKQETFYFDGNEKALKRLSYEQNLTTLRDTSVSKDINDILKDYSNVKLGYKYPNLYVYTDNKLSVLYNVDNKSFTTYNLGNINKISGKYLSIGTKIYSFDLVPFLEGEWKSKEYDLGDAIDEKRFGEIEVYGKSTGDTVVYLDVYVDGELRKTAELISNYGGYFRRRFDLFDRGRYIQFGFRFENNEYLEINEVNMNFKPLKSYKYN